MKPLDFHQLATDLLQCVQDAGRVEMQIYHQGFEIELKSDASPVTVADRAAEEIILKGLKSAAPNIPVVAEEAASIGDIPQTGERFFLVDPLDGTKEFINKSHEFTVNIALIEQGIPVFGIVYVPPSGTLYVTLGTDKVVKVTMPVNAALPDLSDTSHPVISTTRPLNDGVRVVASKSHMNEETSNYLSRFTITDMKSAGSSLKFCLLAEGLADLYPRFAPTMEWDTAAGDAVLRAAGGIVVTEDGSPLSYGKAQQDYRNPSFIAWGRMPLSNVKKNSK